MARELVGNYRAFDALPVLLYPVAISLCALTPRPRQFRVGNSGRLKDYLCRLSPAIACAKARAARVDEFARADSTRGASPRWLPVLTAPEGPTFRGPR